MRLTRNVEGIIMTTDKQLQANKQNAKLGGVKTPEGKAITKFNALKHGLLSSEVLLKGEDKDNLVKLSNQIRESLQPVGEIEQLLTDRIITNFWRLKRAMGVERSTMEWEKFNERGEIDLSFGGYPRDEKLEEEQKIRKKIRDMIANNETEQILRYETTIERSIYKALHELQRLQAARLGEKPPLPINVDIDVSKDE